MLNNSIKIALFLAQQPKTEVASGIQMFLDGNVEGELLLYKWVPQDTKPEFPITDWMLFNNKYWVRSKNEEFVGTEIDSSIEGRVAKHKVCPKCKGSKMAIFRVTINCPKSNPNRWKSRWECSDPNCMHEIYSTLPVADEVRKR